MENFDQRTLEGLKYLGSGWEGLTGQAERVTPEQLEAARDKQQSVAAAYARLFGTPDGAVVLEHLVGTAFAGADFDYRDGLMSVFKGYQRTGQQAIVRLILEMKQAGETGDDAKQGDVA